MKPSFALARYIAGAYDARRMVIRYGGAPRIVSVLVPRQRIRLIIRKAA